MYIVIYFMYLFIYWCTSFDYFIIIFMIYLFVYFHDYYVISWVIYLFIVYFQGTMLDPPGHKDNLQGITNPG